MNEASARDTQIAGHPLLTPMFDIRRSGRAAARSRYLDEAGGFRSARAARAPIPGRPRYGLGGEEPTITDAHLVLGRIDPERFLGGGMPLHPDRAHAAIGALAQRLGVGARGGRRGRPRPRERQHGADHPLDHRRARPRPARLQPRRLRRRGPAARGRARRGARDRRGGHPAAPRHHVRRGPADERPALRPDAHGLRRRGRDRRRGAGPRLRGPRGHARGAPARATAPTPRPSRSSGSWTAATSARATSCGSRCPRAR